MKFDSMLSALPKEIQHKMKTTYQDQRWHPEGSVYDHSRLVALQLPDDDTIQACALIHDIGKCYTSEAKETDFGLKITTFNHDYYLEKDSVLWASMVCRFDSLHINWECVFEVCKHHMRMHKYNDGEIKKASKRKAMEDMKYFEEMKLFADADEKGIGNVIDASPYIILTVGVSGSGKSTWVKSFHESYFVISPDNIRKDFTGSVSDQSKNYDVWKTAYAELDFNIKWKRNIIFDSTCCNLKTVKELLKHCEGKAIPIFKIFECDIDEAARRIDLDLIEKVDRSNVPYEVIERQSKGLSEVKRFIEKEGYLVLK